MMYYTEKKFRREIYKGCVSHQGRCSAVSILNFRFFFFDSFFFNFEQYFDSIFIVSIFTISAIFCLFFLFLWFDHVNDICTYIFLCQGCVSHQKMFRYQFSEFSLPYFFSHGAKMGPLHNFIMYRCWKLVHKGKPN